ncbi:hypothetical protein NE683_12155 [Bariatricus massiliensis]|uniref:Uncharacterized protein n=1 Tax=Bariatricus massiliensis TaxID=1745713 RepID=A0ABS8DH14_9FIRM|nr:hypothetical protein [Bariatricus massiliensis]MCB7304575.1 hypothetical protein [Bariatricus massiliensis]MCB7375227.1 hypothetical protein [Bariatricus massiliensis]MCB7387686.1 hypothetical protein [Bariatricus massiliensis]MCB7411847.1 hypothetical protein [Bariatricus massiliensis]MCQ5253983.1 hypothetical protein [Bariatricus massiliensis]
MSKDELDKHCDKDKEVVDMTITAFKTIKTTPPYVSKSWIQKNMDMGARSVDTRFKEIKEETKRYGEYAYIKDGGFFLVNFLVWVDYLTYRTRLKDKNLRKHVPDFDPEEVARAIGMYGEAESA